VQDVAVLMRLSDAARRPSTPAPEIGEHTRQILAELGYATAEVDELFSEDVVRGV